MSILLLLVVAVLLLVLMAKAIRTLIQDGPRHQRLPRHLQPRLDGDTET